MQTQKTAWKQRKSHVVVYALFSRLVWMRHASICKQVSKQASNAQRISIQSVTIWSVTMPIPLCFDITQPVEAFSMLYSPFFFLDEDQCCLNRFTTSKQAKYAEFQDPAIPRARMMMFTPCVWGRWCACKSQRVRGLHFFGSSKSILFLFFNGVFNRAP